MTTYTYLGYGTTNSNGVAKLDHDANGDAIDHSYTGTGAGEIDVVASLDKPISSGSVVSQPYTVYDCLLTEMESATYEKTTASSGASVIKTFKVGSDTYVFTAPFCFEFNVDSFTNLAGLRLRIMEEDTAPIYQQTNLSGLNIQEGSHVKCVVTTTGSEWFVDGVSKYTATGNAENDFGVALIVLANQTASITISNVYAYLM